MNKKTSIIFIIVGISLFLANVAFLIWWGEPTIDKASMLTFVSGWISGIATLVVGIIAFRQNKESILYSIKNDKLNDINIEKKEIICTYNNLAQCSRYIQSVKTLFENTNNNFNCLSNKLELNDFRDNLLDSVFKFRLYSYMPISMEKIVKKIIEIAYDAFEAYEKLQDEKLSAKKREELLNKVGENALVWTNSIIAIRRDTIKEIEDLKKEIYCCQNLLEIEKLVENSQQKTEQTNKTIQNYIKQIQEKNKIYS